MRKKILGGLAVLAIAAIAAWNVNVGLKSNDLLSDIALANVEALAQEIPNPPPPATKYVSMYVTCFDSKGNPKGSRRACYSNGYSDCVPTSC